MGLPAIDETREILDHAIDVARSAGRIALASLQVGRRLEGVEGKGARELVTEVDRRIERMIAAEVKTAFPDHAIVGEEGTGTRPGTGAYRWIVDPLDGTTNYICGHPFFAISIGVLQGDAVTAGVVFAPYLDEMFFARLGAGAYLNSEEIRLKVTETRDLADAVLATGFAYDRERWPNYANTDRLVRRCRDLRRAGSAALDLAYVAAGRLDGFWELGLRPWDVAAGALLVREAGGRVTDFAGGERWLEGGTIIATNGRLHDAIAGSLDPVPGARGAP